MMIYVGKFVLFAQPLVQMWLDQYGRMGGGIDLFWWWW